MSMTAVADVNDQIGELWAPLGGKELRETHKLVASVNKEYSGVLKNENDTVYISQINGATGELRTVGVDADSFSSEKLTMDRVSIVANRRASASFEFSDLAVLQSQLNSADSEIRRALVYGVSKKINAYLYSLVAPSISAPDHELSSISDMNSAQLSTIRVLAAQAKWDELKPWIGLVSPQYYGDILDDTTLASSDFGGTDRPMVGGKLALPRYGFAIAEDNSLSGDYGLFFHPDFMNLVIQQEMRFKVSDLHSNKQFGYVISADVVFGAALGLEGSLKHIRAQ